MKSCSAATPGTSAGTALAGSSPARIPLPHNFVTPPPTTPGVDDSVGLDVSTVPPPIRVKPAGLHRDPSLGLGRQVSLPPDVAALLRGEAPDTGRAAEPLAQFNSGDWGALLTGELGSVTAVLDQLGEAEMLGGRESIGKLESFGSIQMLTRQRSGNMLTRMGSCNDSFAGHHARAGEMMTNGAIYLLTRGGCR